MLIAWTTSSKVSQIWIVRSSKKLINKSRGYPVVNWPSWLSAPRPVPTPRATSVPTAAPRAGQTPARADLPQSRPSPSRGPRGHRIKPAMPRHMPHATQPTKPRAMVVWPCPCPPCISNPSTDRVICLDSQHTATRSLVLFLNIQQHAASLLFTSVSGWRKAIPELPPFIPEGTANMLPGACFLILRRKMNMLAWQ
jgi:hypothetical protein